MKITKIKIRSLFGLKAFETDGKSLELIGKNGAGKTSVIDAIRYALQPLIKGRTPKKPAGAGSRTYQ